MKWSCNQQSSWRALFKLFCLFSFWKTEQHSRQRSCPSVWRGLISLPRYSTVHELVVPEQLFNTSARKQVGLSARRTHAPNGEVIHSCINHRRQSAVSRLLSTCFWQRWHTGGRYHRSSLINCCGWGVVTSAVVNYCRTQRSNGRFRTIARFSES